jgi:hypothetical protein
MAKRNLLDDLDGFPDLPSCQEIVEAIKYYLPCFKKREAKPATGATAEHSADATASEHSRKKLQ